MDFSGLYNQVEKSVFNIIAKNKDHRSYSGTGFLIGDGTKLLTCAHCVPPDSISILLMDDGKILDVEAKLFCFDKKNDFAILELDRKIGEGLELEDSEKMHIGNEIFTIGFPFYINKRTLLVGNISNLEGKFICINSSVNHGNSGGPLLNVDGKVIGIVNAKMGNLSDYLQSIENLNNNYVMSVGGVNVYDVLKQFVIEMKQNLNLGIGCAIATNYLKTINEDLNKLIK